MTLFTRTLISLAALVVASAVAARAQGISVRAYASASYSVNTNRPDSKLNQLRIFDFDDRKVKLDLVELSLQREISNRGQFGFRIDADAGQSMPKTTAAAGLFRHRDGTAENFDLRQIVVSYIAPIGSGLRLDVGKFVTHIGLDVIDGVDGANDNATRGFLFGFGEPYTHTGLKASYAFSKTVSAMVQGSTGWDVFRDNNHAASFGAQLALTPADAFAVSFNVMAGPERTDNTSDSRLLVDLVSTWKPCPSWSFGLDALVGSEPNSAGAGVDGRWSGAALTVRKSLSKKFALSARGEIFDDAHGDRTGAAQTLTAVTLTPEFAIASHLMVRADVRVDKSTERVFEKRAELVTTQPTVLVGVVIH